MKLELLRVYTKDLSFENPLAPGVFNEEWRPEVEMQLHAGGGRIERNLFEATLKVSIEARIHGKPAMVVEVVVGGVFAVGEAEGDDLPRALGVAFPSMLYPYARETVTALSVRGGLPPFLMQPVDFERHYRERGEGIGANGPAN